MCDFSFPLTDQKRGAGVAVGLGVENTRPIQGALPTSHRPKYAKQGTLVSLCAFERNTDRVRETVSVALCSKVSHFE